MIFKKDNNLPRSLIDMDNPVSVAKVMVLINSTEVYHLMSQTFHNRPVTMRGHQENSVSSEVGLTVALILSMFSAAAFLLNGAIVSFFIVRKDLITPTNVFIMTLSVCDFLIATLGNPLAIVSSAMRRWYFGRNICVWYGFTMTFLGLTTISLLTAISIDRYVLIVHTMRTVTISMRTSVVCVICCGIWGLFWAVMPLLGWNGYVTEINGLACSVDWQGKTPAATSYIIMLLICCLLIPMLILGYSYIRIFMTVSVFVFVLLLIFQTLFPKRKRKLVIILFTLLHK